MFDMASRPAMTMEQADIWQKSRAKGLSSLFPSLSTELSTCTCRFFSTDWVRQDALVNSWCGVSPATLVDSRNRLVSSLKVKFKLVSADCAVEVAGPSNGKPSCSRSKSPCNRWSSGEKSDMGSWGATSASAFSVARSAMWISWLSLADHGPAYLACRKRSAWSDKSSAGDVRVDSRPQAQLQASDQSDMGEISWLAVLVSLEVDRTDELGVSSLLRRGERIWRWCRLRVSTWSAGLSGALAGRGLDGPLDTAGEGPAAVGEKMEEEMEEARQAAGQGIGKRRQGSLAGSARESWAPGWQSSLGGQPAPARTFRKSRWPGARLSRAQQPRRTHSWVGPDGQCPSPCR
ncbi:hypothetical protein G6O67_000941 [Ophiocordyceps sinensis]|uniref:Uncharacterized protein n=1 Tax=Ophiocordyceps sinensis TaxID=72228 RepID=A0A8H4Q035_9HYPO|nr:hypothetical protein G6O67_000941 [Ophiocordyceps sinensis]